MRATLKRAANRVSIFAQRILRIRRQPAANDHNNFRGERPSVLSREGSRLSRWSVILPPFDPEAGPELQAVILPANRAKHLRHRR